MYKWNMWKYKRAKPGIVILEYQNTSSCQREENDGDDILWQRKKPSDLKVRLLKIVLSANAHTEKQGD